MEVSGQLHAPAAQGKCPCYPLGRRLGGPQSHSGRGGEFYENLDIKNTRFEVFMAVKIQVEVVWVLTPCGVAGGYWRFVRFCCIIPP
jgi:hypothetical protein